MKKELYALYLSLLIGLGIFRRFDTLKRHAMLAKAGYIVQDTSEIRALLQLALTQAKGDHNDSCTDAIQDASPST